MVKQHAQLWDPARSETWGRWPGALVDGVDVGVFAWPADLCCGTFGNEPAVSGIKDYVPPVPEGGIGSMEET